MDSSLPPGTRKKLTSWLYYFDDLHLGGFYTDRRPTERRGEIAQNAMAQGGALQEDDRQPGIEAAMARTAAPGGAAATIPTAPPEISGRFSGKRPFLPLVPSESLFRTLDRVEQDNLARIREDLGECVRCRLHKRRTKIVFGIGNPEAKLVFVGEGPGHDEDVQGEPFVGRAGKLLTQMIEAMGLKREDVYICNVVKCRPPENRKPEDDEVAICSPFLYRQIDVIAPKAIVCLGAVAVQALLNTKEPISRYRGQWFDFRGAQLMPTYHPAYLLRNPAAKGEVWKDLQKVMEFLGLPLKKRPRTEA